MLLTVGLNSHKPFLFYALSFHCLTRPCILFTYLYVVVTSDYSMKAYFPLKKNKTKEDQYPESKR